MILLNCLVKPISVHLNVIAVISGVLVRMEIRVRGVQEGMRRRGNGLVGFWKVIGRGFCRFCGLICSLGTNLLRILLAQNHKISLPSQYKRS